VGIPLYQWKSENLKDRIVRKQDAVFIEYSVFVLHGPLGYGADPDCIENFRVTMDKDGSRRNVADGSDHCAPSYGGIQPQPEYSIRFLMVSVVTELCCDVHQDQNAAGHPDGETGDVNKGVPFVSFDISQGAFQIVFNHDVLRQIVSFKREYENFQSDVPSDADKMGEQTRNFRRKVRSLKGSFGKRFQHLEKRIGVYAHKLSNTYCNDIIGRNVIASEAWQSHKKDISFLVII
jgi:hypothetical protein